LHWSGRSLDDEARECANSDGFEENAAAVQRKALSSIMQKEHFDDEICTH
jgi:hypothetical protein